MTGALAILLVIGFVAAILWDARLSLPVLGSIAFGLCKLIDWERPC